MLIWTQIPEIQSLSFGISERYERWHVPVWVLIGSSDYAIDEEYSLERDASPFGILDALGQLGHWYDSKYTFLALGSASVTAIGYSWFKISRKCEKPVFKCKNHWRSHPQLPIFLKGKYPRGNAVCISTMPV